MRWYALAAGLMVSLSALHLAFGYKLVRTTPKIPPPELPPGESLEKFAKTCEYCGDVFGFDYTYKCLYDPSYQTYKDCLLGLSR